MTGNALTNARPPAEAAEGKKLAEALDELRSTLRHSVRDALVRLSDDFFDEADDYLFAHVLPGEMNEDSSQLNAVRELRNKKELFEEAFFGALDAALQATLIPRLRREPVRPSPVDHDMTPSVYEKVEIDLALERMQRKATKLYSSQLEALTALVGPSGSLPNVPDARDMLIGNVLRALEISHAVFHLSLQKRLVFFKLFEKHLLLKMTGLYESIVTMLNELSEPGLAGMLYVSRDAGATPHLVAPEPGEIKWTEHPDEDQIGRYGKLRRQIEEVIESARLHPVPDFVSTMLDKQWRSVLQLIGMRKGVDSREWQEASNVVDALCSLIKKTGEKEPDRQALSELRDEIAQGFELIQHPRGLQENFFEALQELLSPKDSEQGTLLAEAVPAQESGLAVTVSDVGKAAGRGSIGELGKRILDTGDLEEIVALMSDVQDLSADAPEDDSASMAFFLDRVDGMGDEADAEIANRDGIQPCAIRKSSNVDNSYQVVDGSGKVLLTRSRVGLAISLRSGEIRLADVPLH